jgi:rhamnosyltransferase subunit B
MARIVFTTLGSWGDLFPLLVLAKRLGERGHATTIAATPAFRALVEDEGVAFAPIGIPLGLDEYAAHPEILDARQNGLAGIRNLMRVFILPHLARTARELDAACDGADLLVTHPAQLAAPMVAERRRLRWATATVFPGNIPSAYTVPQGNPLPALRGPLGRAANRNAWWISRLVLRALFDRDLNAVRRELGLGPKRDVFLLSGLSPERTLVLCSPHYAPRRPDWPASIEVTGFALWDEPRAAPMPAQLREFLENGSPPVVITLGASLAIDPQHFFALADAALGDAGARGVFLVGRDANVAGHARLDLAVVPFAPLSAVLAHASAIVHHGGLGTTATALRAGVPALVVPRAFDQSQHGQRVTELGVGRMLPWRKLDRSRLATELASLIGETSYRARAASLGAEIAREDGITAAVARLEALLV